MEKQVVADAMEEAGANTIKKIVNNFLKGNNNVVVDDGTTGKILQMEDSKKYGEEDQDGKGSEVKNKELDLLNSLNLEMGHLQINQNEVVEPKNDESLGLLVESQPAENSEVVQEVADFLEMEKPVAENLAEAKLLVDPQPSLGNEEGAEGSFVKQIPVFEDEEEGGLSSWISLNPLILKIGNFLVNENGVLEPENDEFLSFLVEPQFAENSEVVQEVVDFLGMEKPVAENVAEAKLLVDPQPSLGTEEGAEGSFVKQIPVFEDEEEAVGVDQESAAGNEEGGLSSWISLNPLILKIGNFQVNENGVLEPENKDLLGLLVEPQFAENSEVVQEVVDFSEMEKPVAENVEEAELLVDPKPTSGNEKGAVGLFVDQIHVFEDEEEAEGSFVNQIPVFEDEEEAEGSFVNQRPVFENEEVAEGSFVNQIPVFEDEEEAVGLFVNQIPVFEDEEEAEDLFLNQISLFEDEEQAVGLFVNQIPVFEDEEETEASIINQIPVFEDEEEAEGSFLNQINVFENEEEAEGTFLNQINLFENEEEAEDLFINQIHLFEDEEEAEGSFLNQISLSDNEEEADDLFINQIHLFEDEEEAEGSFLNQISLSDNEEEAEDLFINQIHLFEYEEGAEDLFLNQIPVFDDEEDAMSLLENQIPVFEDVEEAVGLDQESAAGDDEGDLSFWISLFGDKRDVVCDEIRLRMDEEVESFAVTFPYMCESIVNAFDDSCRDYFPRIVDEDFIHYFLTRTGLEVAVDMEIKSNNEKTLTLYLEKSKKPLQVINELNRSRSAEDLRYKNTTLFFLTLLHDVEPKIKRHPSAKKVIEEVLNEFYYQVKNIYIWNSYLVDIKWGTYTPLYPDPVVEAQYYLNETRSAWQAYSLCFHPQVFFPNLHKKFFAMAYNIVIRYIDYVKESYDRAVRRAKILPFALDLLMEIERLKNLIGINAFTYPEMSVYNQYKDLYFTELEEMVNNIDTMLQESHKQVRTNYILNCVSNLEDLLNLEPMILKFAGSHQLPLLPQEYIMVITQEIINIWNECGMRPMDNGHTITDIVIHQFTLRYQQHVEALYSKISTEHPDYDKTHIKAQLITDVKLLSQRVTKYTRSPTRKSLATLEQYIRS